MIKYLGIALKDLRNLVVTGLIGACITGGSQGEVTMVINVSSPTSFTITAEGEISGIDSDGGDSNILWIDIPTSPDQVLVRSGTFLIGAQSSNSSFIGFQNRPFAEAIQIRFPSRFTTGDTVNFSGTLSTSLPHGLTDSHLDGVGIYWGRMQMPSFSAGGALQGVVTTEEVVTPTLCIQKNGSNIELTWTGSGVLETSPDLTQNSWTEVSGASSPYIPVSSLKAFYRIKL